MGRRRAQQAEESGEPSARGRRSGGESAVAGFAQTVERPWLHPALVAIVCLLGVMVRLPHAYDEGQFFLNHADESTYFNKAYVEYLRGVRGPLAHGGSGLPLFLEQVFETSGIEPGDPVPQYPQGPIEPVALQAARLAYLVNAVVGAGVVAATYWLARPLLRPAKALLAATLVAFDPFSLFFSGHLMAEQLFTLFVALGFGCAVRSRGQPWWLLPGAGALAVASMARGNGIILFLAFVGFAVTLLVKQGRKGWVPWVAAAVAVYFVAQAPYLLWRAEYLPGPFDYGTNSRLFTDKPWNMTDEFWRTYSPKTSGEKETLGDYLATHSFADVLRRLYLSVDGQIQDLVGGGFSGQGGHRNHPEPSVLHAFLAVPLVLAMVFERRRSDLWFFAWAAGLTVLTFTWIYMVHDSPRYFLMLVPLAAVVAVEGVSWLARRTPSPGLAAAGFVGLFLALFAVLPVVDGLAALTHPNPSWGWTAALTLPWLAMAVVSAWSKTRAQPSG